MIRVGLIGVDTSHAGAFAALLHDETHPHHVPGARIVAAYPGGSPDFELSISRVPGFAKELRESHGVAIVEDLADLQGKCDALMIESIDGRVHLEQFRVIAGWGLPVFIDKPLTVSSREAKEIAQIAGREGVRWFSASSLRFAEAFREASATGCGETVTGVDLYGPMPFQEKCPGYFWYGIHTIEMLYAAMGRGCGQVLAFRKGASDLIRAVWSDGRIAVVRGCRTEASNFGGTIHWNKRSCSFDVSMNKKPIYASLLEEIVPFFRGKESPVQAAEAIEVIRFIEVANESVISGSPVNL